jgi:hypothetical protein
VRRRLLLLRKSLRGTRTTTKLLALKIIILPPLFALLCR